MPTPRWGSYRIIIGRDPGKKPDPKDSHHWKIVTSRLVSRSQLSKRALMLRVYRKGSMVLTNISTKNKHIVSYGLHDKHIILFPGDCINVDPNRMQNLVIKLAGIYILQTQGISGGQDIPMHISSLFRNY